MSRRRTTAAEPPPHFSRQVAVLPATVPFVPPEALERRIGHPIKLRIGANESAFGPSPKAIAAIRAGAERVNWYCDPEGFVLREALARHHGVRRENIGLGIGADDLLGLIVRAFVDPGDPVVMSYGAYPTFAFHVAGFGGRFVHAPYRADRNDGEALAAAARASGARIVYLSNPDNPTGSWLSADEQMRMIAGLPAGARLVLDEAYSDFAPPGVLPELDPEDPRVIRLRTFSKAHGMAGMRVGYAIAPAEIVAAFDKIRHHFGVSRLAQEAALASLGDPGFIADVVRKVDEGRADYAKLAARLGLKSLPSSTNFVAIDLGNGGRARAALKLLLEQESCFLRMPGVAPLDRLVRVTVGTEPERRGFAEALARVLPQLPA
ncbi:MAG TPA: aminotransferase class I/II-fold pyridoxal phosphate-dependent enzyme [Stellaceae bacterium]|nr:aminotransferase class I/II-fold pyridoxal phosphate-dependent enzyme [Stellaceae bacterium]